MFGLTLSCFVSSSIFLPSPSLVQMDVEGMSTEDSTDGEVHCPISFIVVGQNGVELEAVDSQKVSNGNVNLVCEVWLQAANGGVWTYFQKAKKAGSVETWNSYYRHNLPRFATAFTYDGKDYFPDVRENGQPGLSSGDASDNARYACMIAQSRLIQQGWLHSDLYSGSANFNAGNFYHYNVNGADLYLPLDIEELVKVGKLSDRCRDEELRPFAARVSDFAPSPQAPYAAHTFNDLETCSMEADIVKVAHSFYHVLKSDRAIYNRIAADEDAFAADPEDYFHSNLDLVPEIDPMRYPFLDVLSRDSAVILRAFRKAQEHYKILRVVPVGRLVMRHFFTDANAEEFTWERRIYGTHWGRDSWRHKIQHYLIDNHHTNASHESLKADLKDLFDLAGIARDSNADRAYNFSAIHDLLLGWLRYM